MRATQGSGFPGVGHRNNCNAAGERGNGLRTAAASADENGTASSN